ncbi:MAG TPA: DUF6268 family outer membrane beta-barrel protein, partial [Candidatus Methylacidiphilales bacterium]|nr:DUF6268 family outer membrane beta-barrel protein [Candidatus Methylacidiphilales bacterium]
YKYISLLFTAVLYFSIAPGARADGPPPATAVNPPPASDSDASSNIPISQEFTAETSYTGNSETKQGSAKIGGVGNINSDFDYVVSPQISDGILLRFGFDTERNSFSLPAQAPLPNTLQSVNAIIGADFALNDKILLRAELHPGIFSDFESITGNDFDMPVQIGGTYLWNSDFQIIFGLEIDLKSNYPVIGLPGFRWQFADKWVLSAIPPKPQLQYEVDKSLTLYTGAEILDGTYHLNDAFGDNHGHGPTSGNSDLNGNIVDFTEFRAGAGLTWKFTPNMSLDVSGGYMPYRSFDIHGDNISFSPHSTEFHNSIGDGAPYAEIGISGSF